MSKLAGQRAVGAAAVLARCLTSCLLLGPPLVAATLVSTHDVEGGCRRVRAMRWALPHRPAPTTSGLVQRHGGLHVQSRRAVVPHDRRRVKGGEWTACWW